MVVFRSSLRVSVLAGTVCLAACGGSSRPSPPQSPGPGSSDAVQISGHERFGWSQAADNIADYHFAVYVDNNRVELPSTVCGAGSSGGFECTSPLPPLTPGRHALEVVSWVLADGQVIESPRAPALNVNVTGSGTAATAQTAMLPSPPTSPSRATESSARLSTGCGLAPLSSQAFAMWDETGSIRIMDEGAATPRPLVWQSSDDPWMLSGLVAHPGFIKNHLMYVVELAAAGEPALRLTRYREVGNVLGERAVLLQQALDSLPARTSVSFGPDGYLYVALLASPTQQTPSLRGPDSRFLIRVSETGLAAPDDQSGSVFARDTAPDPVAFAWAPDAARPWLLTWRTDTAYLLRRVGDPSSGASPVEAAAPPVAMQIALVDNDQVLYVVGGDGDVQRLTRTAAGWALFDRFRMFESVDSIRDALLLGSGELAACGSTAQSGYGVWRGRLP